MPSAGIVAATVAGLVLVALLIRWLVGSVKSGTESKVRGDSLESNLEAANNAEKILDGPKLSLSARRARARRRRLLHTAGTPGLPDPPASSSDD